MRRLFRERAREAGFTIVEAVITVALLGIVTIAVLGSMSSATESAQFASERNESLDQLRIMAANFTKDIRQATGATAIDAATLSSVTVNTYVNGTIQSVRWRVVTGSDGDQLQRTVGSATPITYVVDLTTPQVFDFFGATDPTAVNRVGLNLATQPDARHPSVELSTIVEMRNVP